MPRMDDSGDRILFDKAEAVDLAVLHIWPGTTRTGGHPRADLKAQLAHPVTGDAVEVKVGIAPWLAYLIPVVQSCPPGETFGGFHLETVGDRVNLVAIDGTVAPEGWAAKVDEMGYGKTGRAGGGTVNNAAGAGGRQALLMHCQTVGAAILAAGVKLKPAMGTIENFDAIVQHLMDKLFERRTAAATAPAGQTTQPAGSPAASSRKPASAPAAADELDA